jgi:hypothetical protein
MKKIFDFTGVETFQRAPEGVHTAKVAKIDEVTFQGGNVGFKITFEVISGIGKGTRVIESYPFVDAAMWKLKAFFEACGIRAHGRIAIDTNKLIGKTVEITVKHEEYNGQLRARIQEVNRLVSENIDDEIDEDEGIDEMEDEEIEAEEKEEEKPKKEAKKIEKKSVEKNTKATKKSIKKATEFEEDEEDDDWDDWDDEE